MFNFKLKINELKISNFKLKDMSFFDWLDKIREKPEPVRKRIAYALTASLVFLIMFVWVSLSLSKPDSGEDKATRSPFSVIKDSVAQIKNRF
ncbi:MAG: hypothetical protein K9M15_00995 [Candidatus Marinimicrobia bacterium]|nr:hypothetical protein [Candidatus Neomarinimicrobiota bacterium]